MGGLDWCGNIVKGDKAPPDQALAIAGQAAMTKEQNLPTSISRPLSMPT